MEDDADKISNGPSSPQPQPDPVQDKDVGSPRPNATVCENQSDSKNWKKRNQKLENNLAIVENVFTPDYRFGGFWKVILKFLSDNFLNKKE